MYSCHLRCQRQVRRRLKAELIIRPVLVVGISRLDYCTAVPGGATAMRTERLGASNLRTSPKEPRLPINFSLLVLRFSSVFFHTVRECCFYCLCLAYI